jgi:hypothetical protein
MEQQFIEFLKNSNKFNIDKNGRLHYSEVFSVFMYEINIEKLRQEQGYADHVTNDEIIRYYLEDKGESKFRQLSIDLATKFTMECDLNFDTNVDNLLDIIEDVVIYEPIISYCQSC